MRFRWEDSLLHNEADSCSYCILSKSLHKVFNSLKTTLRVNHSLWTTLTSIKYLHLVIKASVALIHAELIKFTAIEIIWLFQKEPATIAQNVNIPSSQYIVSTIKLIKVDYTLHRVKRLMIVDSEWMNCDHEQAKKQINCISQKKTDIHLHSTMCQVWSEEDHLWLTKLKNAPCTTSIEFKQLCARHLYKRGE